MKIGSRAIFLCEPCQDRKVAALSIRWMCCGVAHSERTVFFISALYKLLKPQKEIYEAFCNKFGVKAEECFFIDDLPANIEGARKCGMQGFVFDTKDLAELENQLNALGVKF